MHYFQGSREHRPPPLGGASIMSLAKMLGSYGKINCLCRDIKVSKGQRVEVATIKYYTSLFQQMTTRPQRTVKKA